MRKIIAVIGLLAVGAVGWALFGDLIMVETNKAVDTVKSEAHEKAQDITDSIKPNQ